MKQTNNNGSTLVRVIVLVVFMLSAGAYGYLIYTSHQNLYDINNKIESQHGEIENIVTMSSKSRKQAILKSITSNRDKIEYLMMTSEEMNEMTFTLHQMAKTAGISEFSSNVAPEPCSLIPGCKQLSEGRIQLSFNAEFQDFATFLNMLERHDPVIFVDKFSIEAPRKNASRRKTEMVVVFFVGDKNIENEDDLLLLCENIG